MVQTPDVRDEPSATNGTEMTPSQRAAILRGFERIRRDTNTPEKARLYLYAVLGTHNRDGSLCLQYGGEHTDEDHPVHSKKD